MSMEKSRSYPQYSSSCSTEFGFGFQDRANSYIFNGPTTKDEAFAASTDPEMKRKKRIAAYNMFTTEALRWDSVAGEGKWGGLDSFSDGLTLEPFLISFQIFHKKIFNNFQSLSQSEICFDFLWR
ncbi:unnamed protein product [Fraxinus pennsylvanica]|uniref:Uncharacterized protein n=1 Tax=Fraxinus pennsylvanica TaxID=56036 RepID=A0AAD1Z9P5_9LAMI|nr:unnamed protein product [Fraxinus pennsylvanica]